MNTQCIDEVRTLRDRLRRLRTDLSFICSDQASGGPDRVAELAALRAQIRGLEAEIADRQEDRAK